MDANKPKTIDEYLVGLDEDVQTRLAEILDAVLSQFPDATESIRYGMPAIKMNDVHVYFSATKKHIGMYPFYANSAMEGEIAPYRGKNTKDALHFQHNKPLPLEVILKLVEYKFNKQA